MAIHKGAVVVDTRLNNEKITGDFKELDKKTQNSINKYNSLVNTLQSQNLQLKKAQDNQNKLTESIKTYKKEIEDTEAKMKELTELTDSDFINKYNEISNQMAISGKVSKEDYLFWYENMEKMQTAQKEQDKINKELEQTKTHLTDIKNSLDDAVQKEQRGAENIELINSKISSTKDKANSAKKEVQELLDSRGTGTEKSISKLATGFEKLKKRITRLFAATFLFNILRGWLSSLRNGLGQLLAVDTQFANSLNQIKANLMTAFAPIYNAVLPALRSLMDVVSKVTGTLAVFIAGLFGKSIQQATDEAKQLNKTLNKTAEAGDKASGSLASFDKLEVIGSESSGASAGVDLSSGIDLSGEVKYYQGLLDFLNKIKELITPIWNVLRDLFKWLQERIGTIGALLVLAFSGIALKSAVGWLIKKIGEIGTKGKGAGTSLTGFFDGLGKSASTLALFGGLALLFEAFGDFLKKFAESGLKVNDVLALMGIVIGSIVALLLAIKVLGPGLTAALAPVAVVVGLIVAVMATLALTLPPILDALGDFITEVAPSLIDIITAIYDGITNVIYAIGTVLPPIIDSIGEAFEKVFNSIAKIIESIGNTIEKIFNSIADTIERTLGAILNFISKIGPAYNNFIDNCIEATTKLINFLISGIEYLINTLVVGAVNKLIDSINSIGQYVGFTVPNVPNLSIPRFVPRLAEGAVIPPRQEFLAVLGDQRHGTNIEAPLDTIKDAVREVIGEDNGGQGVTLRDWTIVCQIGSKTAQKFVINTIREEEKASGTTLLLN